MEIVRSLDKGIATQIMKQRGYELVSENISSNDEKATVNFAKHTNLGVSFHISVNIKSQTCSLSMVQLKYFAQLLMERFDFFHPQFDKYEKIMYLYTEACISVDDIFKKAEMMTGVSAASPGDKSKVILTTGTNLQLSKEDTVEYDGNHLYITKDGERVTYIKLDVDKDTTKKVKKTIEERKKAFWMELMPIAKQKGFTKEFALEFYSYWTEHGPNDKTFRKELQTKFDISRRMDTFVKNDRKWNNMRQTAQEKTANLQNAELSKKGTEVIDKTKLF